MSRMIRYLISLVRPHQWVKNVFVLLPLFFGGRLMDLCCWREAFVAFFAFSFVASSIYCLNDLRDMEADRCHPVKCRRPLALGVIKPWQAVGMMVLLLMFCGAMLVLLPGEAALDVGLVMLMYFLLNVAYSLGLKHYAIVDVFIVSFGFVLRLVAGGVACDIELSPWIVLMTFLLALFLAFAKRRDDVLMYEQDNVIVRRNIVNYNMAFLNQTLGLLGAIIVVCYVMYTLSADVMARFDTNYLYVTSLFVLAAILRYLQVAIVEERSGSPTRVFMRDRFIQVCIVFWVLSFALIIYF